MADPKQVKLLTTNIAEWNRWRASSPNEFVNLFKVDLDGASLQDADLNGAYLAHANLRSADLQRANFSGANLLRAQLTRANLVQSRLDFSDIFGADLTNASLVSASLTYSRFESANLEGADISDGVCYGTIFRNTKMAAAMLSGARLASTLFCNIDLSLVYGLSECHHSGPSHIDTDTIRKSGRLPLVFLRGIGLPDRLITYLPSLFEQVVQFHSCFISYASEDQPFADRLYESLQECGIRCWYAPHDMKSGRRVHEQIDEAILVYDRLLLVVSEASMRSNWVKTEIAHARAKETATGQRVLFPIALVPFESLRDWKQFDADLGDDSARIIREYFVPDFSRWYERAEFQTAFERLRRDLRTGSPHMECQSDSAITHHDPH